MKADFAPKVYDKACFVHFFLRFLMYIMDVIREISDNMQKGSALW
jgi:hypothetical protein